MPKINVYLPDARRDVHAVDPAGLDQIVQRLDGIERRLSALDS